MTCTTVTVGEVVGDKYYDCVDGKCIEKVGGQYKNDPTCAGKCAAAAALAPAPAPAPVPTVDNTGTYILFGAIALGAALIFGGKK